MKLAHRRLLHDVLVALITIVVVLSIMYGLLGYINPFEAL